MLIAVFIIVPFLVISHVHASRTSSSFLLSSDLLSIFRAYTTGVLRVRQDSIDDGWLYHYMLPSTKVTVDRIGQLLLKDSVHHQNPFLHHAEKDSNSLSLFSRALRYGLGCGTVKIPQNVLVVALRKRPSTDVHLTAGFVVKYAIFKALLYDGLSKEEASVLMSIFPEMPLGLHDLFEIRKLINHLTTPRCYADLFTALLYSIDVCGVCNALSTWTERWPEIIIKLTREYIASNKKRSTHIPPRLFSCLPAKSQYDLLTAKLFTWQPNLAHSHNLYILSRFSESPSEEIQRPCPENKHRYLISEELAQQVRGKLLIRTNNFNPGKIPKEVWVCILLYCDNPLFQIYIVPLVCKSWQSLHRILLSCSITVQKAFIRDWEDALAANKPFTCRWFPWIYFLNSPLVFFQYALVCLESLRPRTDNLKIIKWADSHWQQSMLHVTTDGRPMTPASYLNLYVRLCKVLGRTLELYQLPSISDEEYIASIRNIMALHKIVPLLPRWFLEEDCRMFVQMLERDGSLITLLPKNDLQCRDRLAVCLFLSKHHIPPKADKIVCRASRLHRMLKNVSLGAILQTPAESSGARRLACGPDLETLRKSIRDHCFGWYRKDDARDSESMRSITRRLSMTVMMLLCKHCQDYSEDEFCSILRVLELCGIFDQDSKSYVYGQHVSMLLNDPKFAIELAC